MAKLVNPIAWNSQVLSVGPWEKPDDMPFTSVVSIFASGDLIDPSPEDFGVMESIPDDEWIAILKDYRQLLGPKPCPNCVKNISL